MLIFHFLETCGVQCNPGGNSKPSLAVKYKHSGFILKQRRSDILLAVPGRPRTTVLLNLTLTQFLACIVQCHILSPTYNIGWEAVSTTIS